MDSLPPPRSITSQHATALAEERSRAEKTHRTSAQNFDQLRDSAEQLRGELESTRDSAEQLRGELESTRADLESTRAALQRAEGEAESAEAMQQAETTKFSVLENEFQTLQESLAESRALVEEQTSREKEVPTNSLKTRMIQSSHTLSLSRFYHSSLILVRLCARRNR